MDLKPDGVVLTSLIYLHLGVSLYLFTDSGKSVSAVGGEMLSDPDFAQKIGLKADDVFRSFSTVKVTEQTCRSLCYGSFGVSLEVTFPIRKGRKDP